MVLHLFDSSIKCDKVNISLNLHFDWKTFLTVRTLLPYARNQELLTVDLYDVVLLQYAFEIP